MMGGWFLRLAGHRALFIGAVVLCTHGFGCKFATSASEVEGHYVLHKSEATVRLNLKKDMTYEERIQFASGQVVEIIGKWRFALPINAVELDGAANVAERLEPQHINRINTAMGADIWWFGKYHLAADADQELDFVLQDPR